MKKALMLYLPVLHEGYINFLRKFEGINHVFVIGPQLITELSREFPEEVSLRSLSRDPRCLEPSVALDVLQLILSECNPVVLDRISLEEISECDTIIMPDEEVNHFIVKTFFNVFRGKKLEFVQTHLRWDMPRAIASLEVESDHVIAFDDLPVLGLEQVPEVANEVARRSSDWWRQVGSVLLDKQEILLAVSNRHLPSEYEPCFQGDPRSNFQAGEYIELSSAIHAEAGLIAAAASEGIVSKGKDVFVTTFPCPACAALLAVGGIRRLYFVEGYSNVNALKVLREYEVEIVQVLQ